MALKEAQHAVLEVGLFFYFIFFSFLCVSAFGGSCCILGGALLLTGHFPGAQKCFFILFFIFFLFLFISHYQHSTMIMLERSWPALLSFFLFYYYSLFFLVCLSLSGTIGNFIWRSPASGFAGLVCPSACPLATHARTYTSRHTDSAAPWSGLALAAGQDRPGQATGSCLPGHCREPVWESADGGVLCLGKGLLFFP